MDASSARRGVTATHHRSKESSHKSSSTLVSSMSPASRPSSPTLTSGAISRGRHLGTNTPATSLLRSASPLAAGPPSPSSFAPPRSLSAAVPASAMAAAPATTTTSSSSSSSSAAAVAAAAAARPPLSRVSSRMSRMRSRSPADSAVAAANARRKYTYAAVFLVLTLVSFTIQTEMSAHIQRDLGWDKAYCMMYFTHGSWTVLWPLQLAFLRLRRRDVPWAVFWRRHVQLLKSTALMVQTRRLDVSRASAAASKASMPSPAVYFIRSTVLITVALTVAGLSWYVAVDMTSAADLTAIYNCNAFFAYAFSVPLLGERLRPEKVAAVLIAVAGVLVVAYGSADPDGENTHESTRRFLGNIVIGVGSVLYGLYEVLYKRFACPPDGVSPSRGTIFAITMASCIGCFTLLVLWIPFPILHLTGIEPFRLPAGRTALLVFIAVLSNAVFSGSILVLISLTSPVLSGVASLLTIFLVALADWFVKRKAVSGAAVGGGLLIVVAFLILSWSSYREMAEHEDEPPEPDLASSSDKDSDEEAEFDGYDARGALLA